MWESEAGSQLEPIHLNDYNYAYQPAREYGTLCVVLRSAEQTTLACDDGTDAELSYRPSPDTPDAHSIVLDQEVFAPRCGED